MRTCAGTGESEPIDARPGGRPTAWSAAAAVSASSGSCAAALCDMLAPSLPAGWEKVRPRRKGKHGLPCYYHNLLLGSVQWEHPALTYWRSLLYDLLALEPAHIGDGYSVQPPKHNTWISAADDPSPGTYDSIARLTGATVGAGETTPRAPAPAPAAED